MRRKRDDRTGDILSAPVVEPPRARHTDPHTAHEGAASVAGSHAKRVEAAIVDYVRRCGVHGTTTLEMSEFVDGVKHNNVSSAFTRLRRAGLIHHHFDSSGKPLTRRGSTGRHSLLFFIDPPARQ